MLEASEKKRGKVRYKRQDLISEEREEWSLGQRVGEVKDNLTPSFMPLLAGFTVLLVIVISLGVLSESQIEAIQADVYNLYFTHSQKQEFFNDISKKVDNLNNEARIRAEGKKRGELMPPFEVRLSKARDDMRGLFSSFDHPIYAEDKQWQDLKAKLEKFAEATQNLNSWDEDGFVKYKDIRNDLSKLQTRIQNEQGDVTREVERIKGEKSKGIRTLWLVALSIGFAVVTVTLWEVQRRYKQTQKSNEAARRERLFSTQMLEGMVSAVAAIDSKGRIRSANEPFLEIFPDIDPDKEFQSSESLEIKAKLVAAANLMPVKATAYRGRWTLDNQRNERGVNKTFDLYVSPLDIDGELGHIITLVDVTEAVEAENELRRKTALAAVGQATAQVAHEIRNPLGSIRLGVSMLREMTDSGEAISTIDLVDRGIDHLQKLVVDVTQFSRERPLNLGEVDLHELLERSIELTAHKIEEKQTTIERHYSKETLVGEFDKDQLRQVFVNLLANAIDASETKSPVAITTHQVERDVDDIFSSTQDGIQPKIKKPFVQITITDYGCGMDEETRARIFEPFFSTKAKGTGLGLAIVKQIVESHEGIIEIKSEINRGTSFTIELPLKQDAALN